MNERVFGVNGVFYLWLVVISLLFTSFWCKL